METYNNYDNIGNIKINKTYLNFNIYLFDHFASVLQFNIFDVYITYKCIKYLLFNQDHYVGVWL